MATDSRARGPEALLPPLVHEGREFATKEREKAPGLFQARTRRTVRPDGLDTFPEGLLPLHQLLVLMSDRLVPQVIEHAVVIASLPRFALPRDQSHLFQIADRSGDRRRADAEQLGQFARGALAVIGDQDAREQARGHPRNTSGHQVQRELFDEPQYGFVPSRQSLVLVIRCTHGVDFIPAYYFINL